MPNMLKPQAAQSSPRFQRKIIPPTEKASPSSEVSKKSMLTKTFEASSNKKLPNRPSIPKDPLEKNPEVSSPNQNKPHNRLSRIPNFSGSSFFGKLRSQGTTRSAQHENDHKQHSKSIGDSKDNHRTRANSISTEVHDFSKPEAKVSGAKRFSSILPTSSISDPLSKTQTKSTPTKSNFTIPISSRLTRPTKSFELKTADRRKDNSTAASINSVTASEPLATSQRISDSSVHPNAGATHNTTGSYKALQHLSKPSQSIPIHSPLRSRETIYAKDVDEAIISDSLSSLSSSDGSDIEAFVTTRGSTLSLNSHEQTKSQPVPMDKLIDAYESLDSEKPHSSPVETKNRILSSSSLAAKLSSSRLSLTSNHSRLSHSFSGVNETSSKPTKINDRRGFYDDESSGRSSTLSNVSSTALNMQETSLHSNTPLVPDLDKAPGCASSSETKSLDPHTVLKTYSYKLSLFERSEILDFPKVYFFGQNIRKKLVKGEGTANFGYDDDKGDYHVILHDHLAYRYEILEVLGKGSFGKVVRAQDHKTGQPVAIKLIRNKKQFHTQALVEVKILECIVRWDPDDTHSMIHMYESFYFRNHLCIAFEPLDLNLYEYLKVNSFQGCSMPFIQHVTIQILQALSLLKKHRVVHCDLKPENILLKSPKSSEVKVIDVGSSCFESERIYTYIQSRFYRAPEVILGIPYSMAIDMWSLGCILAELHTAHPIFPGENEKEQVCCIMEALGVPPTHLIEKSARKIVFFDSNNSPRPVINSKGKRRRPGHRPLSQILKCKDNGFVDFVSRCLEWDPQKRLTPEEALNHYWIRGTSPEPQIVRNPPQSLLTARRRKSMIDKNRSNTIGEQSYLRTSTVKPITIRNNKVNPSLGPESAGLLGTSYQSSIDFLSRHARHKLQS